MTGQAAAITPGEHICLAVQAEDGLAERVGSWIHEGLDTNELVICIEPRSGPETTTGLLKAFGLPWEEAHRVGQLVVLSPEDAHLVEGVFDLDRLIARNESLVDASLAEGYRGVRAVGRVADAWRLAPDWDALLAYEHRSELISQRRPLSMLCLCDRDVFGSDLATLAGTHPRAVEDRAVCFRARPGHITAVGEVDIANLDLLRSTLATADRAGDEMVINLAELTFIDLAGARELVRTSRRLGPDRTLRVVQPPRQLSFVLEAAGWADEANLVVEYKGAPQ